MGKYKLNRNGFTLIELLAVIVILAILMLLATPAVLTIMNNARQNSFKTEAQELVNAAKTKYASEAISNAGSMSETVIYYINGSDPKKNINEYVDKNLTGYTGSIAVNINGSGDVTSYVISVANGSYRLCANSQSIQSATVEATGDAATALTDNGSGYGCSGS